MCVRARSSSSCCCSSSDRPASRAWSADALPVSAVGAPPPGPARSGSAGGRPRVAWPRSAGWLSWAASSDRPVGGERRCPAGRAPARWASASGRCGSCGPGPRWSARRSGRWPAAHRPHVQRQRRQAERRGGGRRARRGRRSPPRTRPGRRCRGCRRREEYRTNAARSRSLVASWRFQAASTFGCMTASMRSGVSEVTTASSSVPAVWIDRGERVLGRDVRRGARRGRRRRRCRRRRCRPRAPSSVSSASQLVGAGGVRAAAADQQQVRAPYWVTRWRAAMAPRVPVPPVMRTVPSGFERGRGSAPAGERRCGPVAARGSCRRGARAAARPRRTPRRAPRSSASREASVSSRSASDDPAGVLGLRAADQAPDRGGGQVRDRVVRRRCSTPPLVRTHQRGARPLGVGEVLLDERQGLVRGGVHAVRSGGRGEHASGRR